MREPSGYIVVAEPIANAIAARRPVVALETTLVTHGFPHPKGIEISAMLEAAVAAEGALPATIGIVDGRLRVGLQRDEIAQLAACGHAVKLNLSNLAAHLVPGGWGSTTVAATLMAAHHAGIRVVSTGGIGGVHRNAAETGDVSADLTALDLPRTRELLETLGVPVFGFQTGEFPAFYSRESGLGVDARFEDIEALAHAVRNHFALDTGTGVVVANPIAREHELSESVWRPAIDRALIDAGREGVRGREVTPFLLERLGAITNGASAFSNEALLLGNARVAARLASALCRK